MLISIVPLLVMIAGLLMFAFSENPKVAKLGEIMLWTGMLVTLYVFSHRTVRIF